MVGLYPHWAEIEKIKNQLLEKYHPEDIILFGSCAKGRVTRKSDIDLCVIMDTDDRRKLLQEMLLELDYVLDLDIVIITPQMWETTKDNKATFANIINRTGVSLIGEKENRSSNV